MDVACNAHSAYVSFNVGSFFLLFLFSFPPFALLFPSRFLRCVPRHDSYSATSSSSLPTRSFDFSCRSAGILRKNA